jgi:hypothetical protein
MNKYMNTYLNKSIDVHKHLLAHCAAQVSPHPSRSAGVSPSIAPPAPHRCPPIAPHRYLPCPSRRAGLSPPIAPRRSLSVSRAAQVSLRPSRRAGHSPPIAPRRSPYVHRAAAARCPRLFLHRVTFASLSASNRIVLGRRSLHRKDLNGSKDGAALRCAL